MRRAVMIAALFSFGLFADSKNQVFSDFTTPLPLKEGDTLVVGIVGGWERWDAPQRMIRRVALDIRAKRIPGVWVETVENHKLHLAEELITKAFPDPRKARIVLYGQSLGGSCAVKLAKRLHELEYPVLFAGIIDSYGKDDKIIPPNVAEAINLYQRDSWLINGEPKIAAIDPERTRILGNFRFRYPEKKPIYLETEPWIRRTFMRGHLRMEYDPEVIQLVEAHVLTAIPQWTEPRAVQSAATQP